MSADAGFLKQEVLAAYFLDRSSINIDPFGSGHINDTFLLEKSEGEKFLLQRINHEVFTNVAGLMDNMARVTRHVRKKLQGQPDSDFTSINIILTLNGALYTTDQSGNYWRVISFIPNSVSYDLVTSDEQAYQAGLAFGYFQQLLSDLPGDQLLETIPRFHDMKDRFRKFDQANEADKVDRQITAWPEIEFALSRREDMLRWQQLISQPEFPRRVTHNDTKFNNVLLDKSSEQAICVIDLDTVMPGVVGFDFGDALRTIANEAREDEAELKKVRVNMGYYKAFSRGFLREASQQLTELEKKSLPFAPNYMTFIMGLRFLTDYLLGDVYYKIEDPDHNLRRARAQFRLESELEKKSPQTTDMIGEILRPKNWE